VANLQNGRWEFIHPVSRTVCFFPERTPGVAGMINLQFLIPGALWEQAVSRACDGRGPHGSESFPAGGEAPRQRSAQWRLEPEEFAW
jgi:hypothetical protein